MVRCRYLMHGLLKFILQRAILRDPNVYPCPDEFKPDRFLTPDGRLDSSVKDPELAVFGFGRRFGSAFFDEIDADAVIWTFLTGYVQGGISLLIRSSSILLLCCTYMISIRHLTKAVNQFFQIYE